MRWHASISPAIGSCGPILPLTVYHRGFPVRQIHQIHQMYQRSRLPSPDVARFPPEEETATYPKTAFPSFSRNNRHFLVVHHVEASSSSSSSSCWGIIDVIKISAIQSLFRNISLSSNIVVLVIKAGIIILGTFSVAKFFRYRYQYFFPTPKFSGRGTFFPGPNFSVSGPILFWTKFVRLLVPVLFSGPNFSVTGPGTFFRDQIFPAPGPVPSKKEQNSRGREFSGPGCHTLVGKLLQCIWKTLWSNIYFFWWL